MEQSLSKVLNEKVEVMGCGRTDSGVHAEQFFLHCELSQEPHDKALFRLNQVLPGDIAVIQLFPVVKDFHARFDATARSYTYKIHFRKDPFKSGRSLFLFKTVKLNLLRACSEILLETRDFASFCKSGADNKTTLCDVRKAEWLETEDGLEFHITADRFLRNMVRALVGTMLEVGNEQRSIEEFKQIIELKDRQASGKSAAACGLYLSAVEYPWQNKKIVE